MEHAGKLQEQKSPSKFDPRIDSERESVNSLSVNFCRVFRSFPAIFLHHLDCLKGCSLSRAFETIALFALTEVEIRQFRGQRMHSDCGCNARAD